MKVKTAYRLKTNDIDVDDLSTPYSYIGYSKGQKQKVNVRKAGVLFALMCANKIVSDYLRAV